MTVLLSQSVRGEIPRRRIIRLLTRAARFMNLPSNTEVSVRVVGARRMRTVNAARRQKDSVTDVLSFPQFQGRTVRGSIRAEAKAVPSVSIGDILVYLPLLERRARLFHRTPAQHVNAMIVHSLLHLLGYDHGSARARAQMETLTQRILDHTP
ncbi:MAG: rRNA maturation RNase YbeY [Candidatus Kerfeldbacteria bacterium]|nr:rRNA maturation RNase YbeY [Candidatus Kerfeldbacteria bacterium]